MQNLPYRLGKWHCQVQNGDWAKQEIEGPNWKLKEKGRATAEANRKPLPAWEQRKPAITQKQGTEDKGNALLLTVNWKVAAVHQQLPQTKPNKQLPQERRPGREIKRGGARGARWPFPPGVTAAI